MRNITVTLNDDTYRRARMKATELDTLVKRFLVDLAVEGGEFERLERLEQEVRKKITSFRGSDRLSRDELYERRR